MSVLLGDRKESKFEAITYSIELHDMPILLMQRGFGVKDVDGFVRKKYAYGEISEENFAKYRELMRSFKSKVNLPLRLEMKKRITTMSRTCFAVGWEDIINSYPENNERI